MPNIIEDIGDSVVDAFGLPRLKELIPTPSDVAHKVGVPTVREAVPTPKEVADKAPSPRDGGRGGRFPLPPMPGKIREFFEE